MLGFKHKKALKKEADRQREIVKQSIWPILLQNAKSIKDAKNILKTLTIGMDTVFNMEFKKRMEERSVEPLSTLNLGEFMNTGEAYKTEWALVDALKDEQISTAKGLIEGMGKELDRLTDKELLERSLDSLKTEWL